MTLGRIRANLRTQAEEQAIEFAEEEAEILRFLRKWLRWSVALGAMLLGTLFGLSRFGHYFPRWIVVGPTSLIGVSFLLASLMWAVISVIHYWSYRRDISRLHQKYSVKEALQKLEVRQSRLAARLKRRA